MHLSDVLSITVTVLHLLGRAQAKAVFAHYMVFPTTSPLYTTALTSIERLAPWMKPTHNKTSTTQ